MRLHKLKRDDWRSAIALRRKAIADGEWSPEVDEIIIMMQADPRALFRAMDKDDDGK